jgi:3-phosphoshikimate 1-carboxyvinyltransferase
LETLKIKETDRVAALVAEMRKIGYILKETPEGALEWQGDKTAAEQTPVICTYEDHRMAMSFAPAALKINNLRIDKPQVVTKSYPKFWEDLRGVGFEVARR